MFAKGQLQDNTQGFLSIVDSEKIAQKNRI